jgi:hypothetical protein
VHITAVRLATVRPAWPAAGLAALTLAAVAGCAASSSPAASGPSPAPPSPLSAVQLAAKTTAAVKSVTGTVSIQASAKAGATGSSGSAPASDLKVTATFAEQLHPSLLADVEISSMTAGGSTLPGAFSELLTPTTLYLRATFLTQALHLSKPWLAIPLSGFGQSTGIDLGQLLSQVSGEGPVDQAQLLTGATSVRNVGTSTLDGVPVTEYIGTISLAKAVAKLSGSLKTQLSQAMQTAGLSTASFHVWVDADNVTRKSVITENGTDLSETISATMTSLNQPVTISVPPASQTQQVPAGELSGS